MSPELTSGLLALADRLQLIRRGMLEVITSELIICDVPAHKHQDALQGCLCCHWQRQAANSSRQATHTRQQSLSGMCIKTADAQAAPKSFHTSRIQQMMDGKESCS